MQAVRGVRKALGALHFASPSSQTRVVTEVMDSSYELSVQDVIKFRSLINLPCSEVEQNKGVSAEEANK